jgi:hypothetical protein
LRVAAAEWTSILLSRTSWLLDAELRVLDQRCLRATLIKSTGDKLRALTR